MAWLLGAHLSISGRRTSERPLPEELTGNPTRYRAAETACLRLASIRFMKWRCTAVSSVSSG